MWRFFAGCFFVVKHHTVRIFLSDLCVWEGRHVDAVLDEDGLDLRLQLSSPTQHPHAVAVWVERRAFPWINAHHHSVVLRETDESLNNKHRLHFLPFIYIPLFPLTLRWFKTTSVVQLSSIYNIHRVHKFEGNPDLQSVGLLSTDADLGDAAVPGNSQDPLRVPALRLSRVSGRKSYNIVPPVPLQDPHDTPCGFKIRHQYELQQHVKSARCCCCFFLDCWLQLPVN